MAQHGQRASGEDELDEAGGDDSEQDDDSGGGDEVTPFRCYQGPTKMILAPEGRAREGEQGTNDELDGRSPAKMSDGDFVGGKKLLQCGSSSTLHKKRQA